MRVTLKTWKKFTKNIWQTLLIINSFYKYELNIVILFYLKCIALSFIFTKTKYRLIKNNILKTFFSRL